MTLRPDDHDLHAWVDGEADDATAERVKRYVAENPRVARNIEGWRHDAQLLRQAMSQHSIALNTPEPHYYFRRSIRQQRQWKLASACVLVLSLSVGGYTGWQLKDSQVMGNHQPMEDAVQAYKLFSNEAPMDVVANQQTELAPWVARYFVNGNQPPNLEQYGFKLLGARLMATAQGAAALVMYQDPQGTRVAWYIRPLSPVKLQHGQRLAKDVMAQYWSDEHYNYALVTPLNASEIGDVRKAVSLATS